ncbi:hypothetical protein [Bdellovibrio sp. HCB337]|uniref:hypothetical protein n=1 Tax=Bdellovibrio sp. HCB337 TaxID=3394358 RepID=UPI0039A69949
MKHFGLRIWQTLIGFSVLALVSGCSREPDTHKISGDIKTRIPFTSEGGAYSLQAVSLSGIRSLYEFSGKYVTFYMSPSVSDSKLTGHQPKTRFIKAGDVYVPEDVMSQQLAVIYAHFQRLAALDNELGAEGVNTWPRDVGVGVRYKSEGNRYETNNAFYDGSTDSMLVVPYTQNNLPIAVNAGILAHEHFHSLYFKLVEKHVFKAQQALHGKSLREEVLNIVEDKNIEISKPLPEDNDSFTTEYHALFSRGINEGLADFWAWIYTGDPDFLQHSLPSEKDQRTMNIEEKAAEEFVFPNSEIWKMEVLNRYSGAQPRGCRGVRVSYCLGSKYARLLKHFSGVVQDSRGLSSLEARKLVGTAIVKALPTLKESLLSIKTGEYFDPSSFFKMLQDALPDVQTKEKTFLEKLVVNAQKKAKIDEKSVREGETQVNPTAEIIPAPILPDEIRGRK